MKLVTGMMVLALAACDSGTAGELARAQEMLADHDARITELRSELDALKEELAAERINGARAALTLLDSGVVPGTLEGAAPTPEVAAPSAIQCVADRCTIDRASFDALTADVAALSRQARFVPSLKDDVIQGFKIFGVRPTSPFRAVGLKNGDLVTELAGKQLRGMEDASAAYDELRARDEWSIVGERQGARFTITIVVTK